MCDTNRTTPAPKSATHRPVDEQPVVDPLDIEDTLDLIQELINRVRRAVLERMEADQ